MRRRMIDKSFEWIPFPGLNLSEVIDSATEGCLERKVIAATGGVLDHVWTTTMNNNGTVLFLYVIGLFEFEQAGKKGNCWYVKRLPECDGLDVFDCPRPFLEATVPVSEKWRGEILRQWEEE